MPSDLVDIPDPIKCLHTLFEHQADQTPHACAVIDRQCQLTYAQLDRYANQFAHYLRGQGIGSGDSVGLFCRRSADAIASMLGILKVGAAYVPLDEVWPDDRIADILNDAQVRLLVTDRHLQDRARSMSVARLIVHDDDAVQEQLQLQPYDRIAPQGDQKSGSDLCYIIYTSGTTGRSKGIMTEHRHVVAFTRAFRQTCRMSSSDRVYQGFSLTFDGSVEEIWMAFSSGSTLVIGPPELAKLGAETAQYMRENQVTFFSTVPTFLSMIHEDSPSLRLIVVSGEACPPALIKRWVRPGLRMLNVYGPTETTVNTTAWDCQVDVPVAIGKPLAGYTTYILDQHGQPVSSGEEGELYIGGVGVARGYLNQPELTAKHFVNVALDDHRQDVRLYRTGDRVRLADNDQLMFLGRIDSQVKVRGYRIELGEIESVIGEHDAIDTAVVTVTMLNGMQKLAAYVKLAGDHENGLPRGEVFYLLKKRLPDYMIPDYLDQVDELPRLTSGKIDRNALPDPYARLVDPDRQIIEPCTETQRTLVNIWEQVFQMSPVSVDDDFFTDLGGDSLLAVHASILLRDKVSEGIGVREVYQFRSIEHLAEHVDIQASERTDESTSPQDSAETKTAQQVFDDQSVWTRRLCVSLQALTLVVFYGVPMMVIIGLVELYYGVATDMVSVALAVWITAALFFGGYPLLLCFNLLVKWIVIGKYKPGSYPLWGMYYFRWWLVTRVQRMSGVGLIGGTPLINIYFRFLGARIGRGCVIHTGHCGIFDLLAIGDHTCIGSETQLLGYRVHAGRLEIGSVTLGNDCYIGIQSAIGLDTTMGDGAMLDDLSLLADGQAIPANQMRQGAPCMTAQVSVPEIAEDAIPARRSILFGLLSIPMIYAVQLLMLVASLPSLFLLIYAYAASNYLIWISVLLLAVPMFEITFWLLHIMTKACILHRAKPGVYRIDSFYFLRKWYVDAMLSLSRLYTLPLYTTLYLPPLLRMLGAKIGPRAELSVIVQMSPDLVEMGEESFFADGSIVGGLKIYRGHFELAMNRIGRRSFLGNSAVLPVGGKMADQCLLGVLSSPPASMTDKTEWLGSPPFALPHRNVVQNFDDDLTYKPPRKLYMARLVVDAMRIAIPGMIEIIGVIAAVGFALWAHKTISLISTLILAPVVSMTVVALMVLGVVGVKHLLFHQYEPVIKPLWSPYVWFNEVVNGVHESIAAPMLSPLLGTPFFSYYLRMMGCKVGKHVFIDTHLFGEFDLVEIGDHAAINVDVVVQNHLFEDRVFKSSNLVIANNCSIGNMAVILYDSQLDEGSSVDSLSLVMKGEHLPAHSHWTGIPIH